MEWFMVIAIITLGTKLRIKQMDKLKVRNKMHQYTIYKGKMIGDFERLYKDFKDPFLQTEKEKFEISKKIIINYCEMIKNKKKRQ